LFILFISVAFHSKKALLFEPAIQCCGDVLKGIWCCWFFVERSGCIRSGLCWPWGGRRLDKEKNGGSNQRQTKISLTSIKQGQQMIRCLPWWGGSRAAVQGMIPFQLYAALVLWFPLVRH
jgi:hypothetical protein